MTAPVAEWLRTLFFFFFFFFFFLRGGWGGGGSQAKLLAGLASGIFLGITRFSPHLPIVPLAAVSM